MQWTFSLKQGRRGGLFSALRSSTICAGLGSNYIGIYMTGDGGASGGKGRVGRSESGRVGGEKVPCIELLHALQSSGCIYMDVKMYLGVWSEVGGAGSEELCLNAPGRGGERLLLTCIPGPSPCNWHMKREYSGHRRQYDRHLKGSVVVRIDRKENKESVGGVLTL